MAKSPDEVHHRFRIICETDSERLGPLLAQLTIMGLENIGYELITTVNTYNRKPKTQYESTAAEFAEAWIKDHPTFHVAQLGQHFRANGRPQSTANYIARILKERGRLRAFGEGNYQSTDIKQIEAPKPKLLEAPKALKRPPNPVPQYETPNRAFVIKAIRNRKRITAAEVRDIFVRAKRNPKSASPILTFLQQDKMIRTIGPGEYEVLPAIKNQSSTKYTAESRKANLEAERLRAKTYRANKKKANAEPVTVEAPVAPTASTPEAANG